MTKTMKLEIHLQGGGYIEKEIAYKGNSLDEIARSIDNDNNDLLEYMQTGDFKGVKSFCFGGFIFQKAGIVAARMLEPDI